jgi:predicted nucleic acid-binding protein
VSLALLDTSVMIASSDGEVELPPTAAISVVTLGELHAGVLHAPDGAARAARARQLAAFRATFEPLLVDRDVAEHYGRALALARSERRTENALDLLIVATASATRRELHTRDARQAKLARRMGLVVHGPGA